MKLSFNFLSFFIYLTISFNLSFGQTTSVKLEVRVPTEGLKKEASIFVAGSFNCWNPHDSLFIMQKISDDSYSLVIPVFEDKKYEYKFTQGDWGSVETAKDDSEMKNREFVSHKDLVVKDTVFKWKTTEPAQKEDTTFKFSAEQLKELSKLKVDV